MTSRERSIERFNELEEIVNVPFSRPLTFDKLQKVFQHLYQQTGARVEYTQQQHHSILEGASIAGILTVSGTFVLYDPHSTASFRTYNERDLAKVAGFRFETIPGYEIEEHAPLDIELMRTIKKHVQAFS